jgi:predicted Zn-dependent peptidase
MKPTVLNNGLRVHLAPSHGTGAVTFLVLIRVGSRYEYPEINGASHFIEHLMFKGTKRRPSTAQITRMLDAVGADYNAYTGKDATGYHITIAAEHLPLAVDLLYDMLFRSLYKTEEVDRERGVIIEEINMYRDNPMMHVEELMEQALFPGNTLGWDIAGSAQTMRSMTRDAVIAYRDAHYVPSRMVAVVAGKIPNGVLPLIKKTFGSVKPGLKEPESSIPVRVQNKDTKQIQVAMGFYSFGMDDKRNPAVSMLGNILGGTMSSRLFIQVRERKGLCYFVRAGNSAYEDVGVFAIQSGLDRTRLPVAMKTIREEIRRIKKDGVSARELREARENIRGRLLLKLEDSSEQAEWYGKQELFLGSVKTFGERMKEFAKVTPKAVQKVANEILNEKRMGIGVVGPFKDGKAFLKASGI